jgi:hypothetical protein
VDGVNFLFRKQSHSMLKHEADDGWKLHTILPHGNELWLVMEKLEDVPEKKP